MDATQRQAQRKPWAILAQRSLPLVGSTLLLLFAVACGLVLWPV